MTAEQKADLRAACDQIAQLGGDAVRFFGNAVHADASLALALAVPRQAAPQVVAAATGLVRSTLLEPSLLDASAPDYFKAMTARIDAQFGLIDAAFGLLDHRLTACEAAAERLLLLLLVCGTLAGALAAALMTVIVRSTGRTVTIAQAAAEALAQGDLGHRVQVDTRDEIGHMANTLGQAMQHLAGMVREIKSTDSVSTASARIAAANGDLSARTEQTAANLQEAASAMAQSMPRCAG